MKHFKLKCWLTALVMVLSGGIFCLPSLIVGSIPAVSAQRAELTEITYSILATGELKHNEEREVYLEFPSIIGDVLVKRGEEVNAGDLLFTVDVEATKKALAVQTVFGGMFSKSGGDLSGDLISQAMGIAGLGELSAADESLLNLFSAWVSTQTPALDVDAMTGDFTVTESVTAPVGGTVTDVLVGSHSTFGAYAPAVVIQPYGSLMATINVPEADASRIRVGQTAIISGAGFVGAYEAVVTGISPVATRILSQSLTQDTVVEVVLEFLDPDAMSGEISELKSGYSITAEIDYQDAARALLVPYEAVRQDENNMEYVMVYQNGRVRKRIIATEDDLYSGVVVSSGLGAGELIVLEPDGLTDGAVVILSEEGNWRR